jgi:hypothetical protein
VTEYLDDPGKLLYSDLATIDRNTIEQLDLDTHRYRRTCRNSFDFHGNKRLHFMGILRRCLRYRLMHADDLATLKFGYLFAYPRAKQVRVDSVQHRHACHRHAGQHALIN